MAYDPNNLSALSYANGFTLWHYKTPDLSADIDTSGYFDEAVNMLRIGDFIMANTAINATVSSGVFIVRANSEIGVDVANISSFGLANTD
jgi:outer membrane protein assembly factor BamB